ncbi:MAG: 30S ribosome-binding factor RbfA [Verrucomicrobiota bacterium]
MSQHRIERVSKLVKQQIGEILLELNLTGCGFITVTSAIISPDLKDGRIYVSVIGTAEQQQRALLALETHHGRIQRELGARIILKYTPRLKFILDETEARAQHIESLINKLAPPDPDE